MKWLRANSSQYHTAPQDHIIGAVRGIAPTPPEIKIDGGIAHHT